MQYSIEQLISGSDLNSLQEDLGRENLATDIATINHHLDLLLWNVMNAGELELAPEEESYLANLVVFLRNVFTQEAFALLFAQFVNEKRADAQDIMGAWHIPNTKYNEELRRLLIHTVGNGREVISVNRHIIELVSTEYGVVLLKYKSAYQIAFIHFDTIDTLAIEDIDQTTFELILKQLKPSSE